MAEGLGAVQESLLQEITCNICFRLMEDPRSLPCTHVYCNGCLKRLLQCSQVTLGCLQCPECRKMIHTSSNDTLDLPKDFRTVRLKEVYEKMLQIGQSTSSPTTSTLEKHVEENTLKCHVHGSPIEMYCISCKDILCQECIQIHQNHKYDYLIEKNAIGRNINEQSVAHKSRLDDYSIPLHNSATKECDNCAENTQEMVVSGDYCCISIGSDVLEDTEQHENHQKQLSTAIAIEVNEYKSKVTTAITEVVQTKAEVDSQARTRQSQVDAAFEEMISLVQSKWKQVNKEIADEQREKSDILSQQKDQLSLIFSKIASVLTACSSQTMQDYESIQQRLKSLQKSMKMTLLKPAVTADVSRRLTEDDLMETCCKQCVLRYRIPEVSKCKLTGEFLTAPETDKCSIVSIEIRDSKGDLCPGLHKIETELTCIRNNLKATTVSKWCRGMHSLSFTPSARGRHVLSIILDNIPHPQCPIALFIKKNPKTFRDPIHTMVNPNGPTGLHFYNDQLVVSEQSSFSVSFVNEDGSRVLDIETGGEVAFDTESQCFYIANAITYQLHKFDANGVCLEQVGTQGSDPGQLLSPRGMQFYNGELYVIDSENHRIHVFDKDLQYLRHFGGEGTSNGCFKSPTDVAINNNDKLYVTDTLNNRIQVMDHKGKFICNIKKRDKQCQHPHMPQKIKIFRGYIYTTEYQMNSVCVFTVAGDFVTTFGQGHITHPEGIAIDKDGYVYVTSNKESIVVF